MTSCRAAVAVAVAAIAATPTVRAVEPSPPPPAAADASPAAGAVPAEAGRMIRAAFDCDDGRAIEVRFFPEQGVAVLVDGGRPHELQQQVAASGYRYASGPVAIRGKGDALRLEIGRRMPIDCRERR